MSGLGRKVGMRVDRDSLRKSFLVVLILVGLVTASLLVIGTLPSVFAGDSPIIWTDKADYWPEETVTISGIGFEPNQNYDILVIRPDNSVVKGDGTFTPGWDTLTSDGNGQIEYYYELDGILGLYQVKVFNSPYDSTSGQIPLAEVTFTDAPPKADLSQVRNGAADSPTNPGDWVSGNAGKTNSHYIEGYSIPYRAVFTDMPLNIPITFSFGYEIKHGDKNALDYITYYNYTNDPSHYGVFGHNPENIDPLIGTGITSSVGVDYYQIPTPSSAGSPVSGEPGASFNSLGASDKRMTLFGGDITAIAYISQGSLTASNSETIVNVTFKLNSSTAVLAWGGHIASRVYWGYDSNGSPNSAGGINGSPYHTWCENWTWDESLPDAPKVTEIGGQDRSLSADAVLGPVTIIVHKYNDLTGNGFTPDDLPLSGWTIKLYKDNVLFDTQLTGADGNYTWDELGLGSYRVDEVLQTGWYATNLTSHNFGTVSSGKIYQYNFTNTEYAKICVFKYLDANEDGNYDPDLHDVPIQGWSIWVNGTTSTKLVTGIDGKACLPGLVPGIYYVEEEERAGWNGFENATIKVSVTLQSGSNKTVWFGNNQIPIEKRNLCVFKYEDVNGDGKYDPADGDKPIQGWTVWLNDSAGLPLSSGQTDPDGMVCFYSLDLATYKVEEERRQGWYGTENGTGPITVDLISGVDGSVWFGNTRLLRTLRLQV